MKNLPFFYAQQLFPSLRRHHVKALALCVALCSPAVWAQHVPLMDLPELPTQVDDQGRVIFGTQSGEPDAHTLGVSASDSPRGQVDAFVIPNHNQPLPPVHKPTRQDGGWEGLAQLLRRLEPRVDTYPPETRNQLYQRLDRMLSQGQYQAVLAEVQPLQTEHGYIDAPGEDVQLRFLEARALAASGQTQQAISRYRDLNTKYPELPEPYNNLAVLQLQLGLVDEAHAALQTATMIRPNYGTAQHNLALVHLLKAQHHLEQAAQQGIPYSAQQAQAVQQIIHLAD